MLFDVMVALMFMGVIALLLVGLAVIVVKKLCLIHKEEGGKPAATAKRMGVFALGGLTALLGGLATLLETILGGVIGGLSGEGECEGEDKAEHYPYAPNFTSFTQWAPADVTDIFHPNWDEFYNS